MANKFNICQFSDDDFTNSKTGIWRAAVLRTFNGVAKLAHPFLFKFPIRRMSGTL